jgi:superfamily II DNA or RNA helicase
LRPYQATAIAKLREAYGRGRRAPCLVLPTGAGKTVVAAEIIRSATARGRRSLFLADRTELIEQTVAKLALAGVVNVRVIQAERDDGRADAFVAVASVDTLTRDRWDGRRPAADLIIQDECHHVVAASYRRVVDAYPCALLLGLTATPARHDGLPLGDVFDELVIGPTVRELTDLGHLVRCRVWAPSTELKAGKIALDPVAVYQQHGRGARAIVFPVSVEHARAVVADFVAAGITAEVVTGKCSATKRKRVLAAFAAGEVRVVASCGVLTEGFDCPAAGVAILARRFGHAGAFLQAAGRILRPAPGKTEATLIDLCGSVHVHGTPDMDRSYSLTGEAIRAGVERDEIRQCRTCGSVFPSAARCTYCGADMPARPIQLPRSTGEGVVEVDAVRPPPRSWVVLLPAKHAGQCAACAQWFPPGTAIRWAKGARPRHQQCPTPGALSQGAAA